MRLEPIEKPKGIMMRLAYWGTRRMFGKVMTPIKVASARMPESLKMSNEIVKFETKKIQLEPTLHLMVAMLASQINGCGFCIDLAQAMVVRENLDMEKFNVLSEYKTSPLFSDRERAALTYVKEITGHRHVSDETFEALRKHFSEREIVEITWVNAIENYYNLINIPLEIGSDGFCAIAQAKATKSLTGRKNLQISDETRQLAKAIMGAGLAIGIIIEGLTTLASVVTRLLRLPPSLNLQPISTIVGGALLIAGIGLVLWLFRYRSPRTMIVSTYYTFVKMLSRAPASDLRGRSEPLIVSGPQRYVRHPLYLGAIAIFLGWGLLIGSTASLVGVALIVLWFRMIQIPFEEKELRALFGDQYVRYSKQVPMLIPFFTRRSLKS